MIPSRLTHLFSSHTVFYHLNMVSFGFGTDTIKNLEGKTLISFGFGTDTIKNLEGKTLKFSLIPYVKYKRGIYRIHSYNSCVKIP